MRADENGTKLLAALNHAASKGIKIQLLIDGIYQQLFLAKSRDFQALASWENVEVRVYNPVTPAHLLKVNYRMHDKYLIIDEKMYLLGGRNSNDIFLGDHIKIDSPFFYCLYLRTACFAIVKSPLQYAISTKTQSDLQ